MIKKLLGFLKFEKNLNLKINKCKIWKKKYKIKPLYTEIIKKLEKTENL